MRQAIDLLEGLIPGGDEAKDIKAQYLTKLIVFAVMWSLGSVLELDDRKKVGIQAYQSTGRFMLWRVSKQPNVVVYFHKHRFHHTFC